MKAETKRPAGIRLRPAAAGDSRRIRSLILRVGINPTGLDWHRFLLAVDAEDRLIACGQVKPHGDGTRELASIAVRPAWRRKGVASAIIADLQGREPAPLWLTCRSPLTSFYHRFGFEEVLRPEAMPRYFQRVVRLARIARWFRSGEYLAVMIWKG